MLHKYLLHAYIHFVDIEGGCVCTCACTHFKCDAKPPKHREREKGTFYSMRRHFAQPNILLMLHYRMKRVNNYIPFVWTFETFARILNLNILLINNTKCTKTIIFICFTITEPTCSLRATKSVSKIKYWNLLTNWMVFLASDSNIKYISFVIRWDLIDGYKWVIFENISQMMTFCSNLFTPHNRFSQTLDRY